MINRIKNYFSYNVNKNWDGLIKIIFEIIFDLIIIAFYRHLTHSFSIHFFNENKHQALESVDYLAEFLIVWIIWLFFMYYMHVEKKYTFFEKLKLCFLFLILGFYVMGIYLFENFGIQGGANHQMTFDVVCKQVFIGSVPLLFIFIMFYK